MRSVLAAFAAVALVCSPAQAQQQTVWYSGVGATTVTGSLVTGPTDTVVADLPGSRWATARWSVTTAGTATITTEVSLDNGVNWIASAYSKRLDAVSANPSVSPWSNNSPVAGSAWETPLPANATNFRLRCGTSGTATVINVSGGTPYTPGAPVTATLADVTESGIGAGITATIYDISGWSETTAYALSPTTQVFTVRVVDDAGTALSGGMSFSFPAAAAGATLTFSRSGAHTAFASAALTSGQWVAGVTAERRISVTLPSGGTVSTGRYRITASR